MTEREQDFYNICYDCLYYGYTKKFIFETYNNIIKEIGEEKAKEVYTKAFEDITTDCY